MAEFVEIHVSGARALFFALAPHAAQAHQDLLDDDVTLATAYSAILALGGASPDDAAGPGLDGGFELRAFIGRRVHLKLKKAVRDGLAACVPIVIKLSSGTHAETLLAVAGAFAATFSLNVERLSAGAWEICLAVQVLEKVGAPATEDEIARFLAAGAASAVPREVLQGRLDDLARKGILDVRQGRYQVAS